MKPQFNLISEPWIPVLSPGGERCLVSLRDALVYAPAYRSINASLPHVSAALLRLLLAVLHRVFGPANSDAWEVLWNCGEFDAGRLDAYFERWGHRFDLFASDHPFFQCRHPLVEEKPAQVLLQAIGGGDTFTLFDHVLDRDAFTLPPAEAAQMLVAAQSFSLAGLCHPQLKLVYTDAPCSRAVVFFVEGRSLFETLMFNLVSYNQAEPIPWMRGAVDLPAWESDDPYLPERSAPLGYLDYLTWPNRRILLIPAEHEGQTVVERITSAPGLVLTAEQHNPMHHYQSLPGKKKGEVYAKVMRFSEGHALWRDSHALLDLSNHAIDPPRALTWISELVSDDILPRRRVQLAAYGMCTEPGKQKVNFYRGESFEIDDLLLGDSARVAVLGTALNHAEGVRRELWSTLTSLANLVLAFDSDQPDGHKPDPKEVQNLYNHWNAEGLYWGGLELPFYRFLDGLPQEDPQPALVEWHQAVRAAAWTAYRQTVDGLGQTQKAYKAAAVSRGRLEYGIRKVLGK